MSNSSILKNLGFLLEKRLNEKIKEQVFPGCVSGVVLRSGEKLVIPLGSQSYDEGSLSLTDDSIFDIASVTKSIPTGSLALKLLEQGKIGLEDPVIRYVPEINNADRERLLVKHLLTHTVHFGFSLSKEKDKKPDELLNLIFTSEFKSRPGSGYHYSNASIILLGLIIERVTGEKLDALADKIFFNPLGMKATSFDPKEMGMEQVVPTEVDVWRGGIVKAEVHDESAFVLSKKMVVGSAGLFSTVPDLLIFMEMLLNKGSLNGREYFKPETIQRIYANQTPHLDKRVGLGWDLDEAKYMGKFRSKDTFGKAGFTGCVCIADIGKGVAMVLLSNHTFPHRGNERSVNNSVRREMADIVFGNVSPV